MRNRRRPLAAMAGVIAAAAVCALPACAGNSGPSKESIKIETAPDVESVIVERVIDGDTIQVRTPPGQGQVVITDPAMTVRRYSTELVRVLGIDTPETVKPDTPVQCWGPQASEYAHHALDGRTVSVEADTSQDDRDRYGRQLRYVTLPDGSDYGLNAIAAGIAKVYTYGHRKVQRFDQYNAAQNTARAQRAGLWGACPT